MSKHRRTPAPIVDVVGSAMRRARLASLVRETAEELWGVSETVDASPVQLARLILSTLTVAAWHERARSAAERTLDMFEPDDSGQPYRFSVKPGTQSIILSAEVVLVCPGCGELGPPQLRNMTERPEVRNQPLCAKCRHNPRYATLKP